MALLRSKIMATIGNIGDRIGWESDNVTVGPVAAAAKRSLLQFVPHMVPTEGNHAAMFRLVLEHGDFGIHNMSIVTEATTNHITSLYDWETGCVVPAILSDPEMAVTVDLTANDFALPSVTRLPKKVTVDDLELYASWSRVYFKVRCRWMTGLRSS